MVHIHGHLIRFIKLVHVYQKKNSFMASNKMVETIKGWKTMFIFLCFSGLG